MLLLKEKEVIKLIIISPTSLGNLVPIGVFFSISFYNISLFIYFGFSLNFMETCRFYIVFYLYLIPAFLLQLTILFWLNKFDFKWTKTINLGRNLARDFKVNRSLLLSLIRKIQAMP